MKIKDIMTTDVEVLSPDTLLVDCAKKMQEINVGAIPVCDGDKILGMVTDRDIVVHGIAKDMDVKTTAVTEIIQNTPVYCFEDDDISKASDLMKTEQIRRLIVVDQNKKLCGVVSIGDIAAKTQNEQLSGETLQDISQPSHKAA